MAKSPLSVNTLESLTTKPLTFEEWLDLLVDNSLMTEQETEAIMDTTNSYMTAEHFTIIRNVIKDMELYQDHLSHQGTKD